MSNPEKYRAAKRVVTHIDPTPDIIESRTTLESSLSDWMRHYLPDQFSSPFAPNHLTCIRKLETAATSGGMFALAMPRGSGKTTLCQAALLWALLTGRRRYCVSINATLPLAAASLKFFVRHLEDNDRLNEAYPHVTTYFRAAAGVSSRLRFQTTASGRKIGATVTAEQVILPYGATEDGRDDYPCAGSCLQAASLTGAIRGKKLELPGGKSARPDFIVLDDPQTRESAESPTQCDKRERTITGDVLGLAGPRKRVAAVMPCTILHPHDLAARFLSHHSHPEWQGETSGLVVKWPDAQETLWRQYAHLYRDSVAAGRGMGEATKFYEGRRQEMDAGAEVSWEHRIRDGEISALQTAENLLLESGEQFWAEYQNAPRIHSATGWKVESQDVLKCLSRVPRGIVPDECSRLTLTGDLNLYGISWVAVAWNELGAGFVVDWGKYPAGQDSVIWREGSHETEDQAVFRAACSWASDVFTRPYRRADNAAVRVDAIALDSSYRRDPVFMAGAQIRKAHQTPFLPIRGMAAMHYRPRNETQKGPGWHVGQWGRGSALFGNTDLWRETAQRAWLMPVGGPGGSIALYGDDPAEHRVLAHQVEAEYVVDVLTSDRHGRVLKWDVRPGERNDLGDALVYAFILASFLGVRFGARPEVKTTPTPAIKQPEQPAVIINRSIKRTFLRPSRGGFVGGFRQ